jgi:putative membrane protein
MKAKLIALLSGVTLFSSMLLAINANAAAMPTVTPEQKQKDAEIIAVLVTLNKNEVAAAKEALKKAKTPAVKKYAKMLKQEHTANLAATLKVSKKIDIAPLNSVAAVVALQQGGKEELVALEALKGNEFDKAYIDAMVKDHTNALNLIDNDLMKNVTNPALKAQIEATRPHIAMHLQEGQMIQTQLNQSTAAN